jgi:hypothetical protein
MAIFGHSDLSVEQDDQFWAAIPLVASALGSIFGGASKGKEQERQVQNNQQGDFNNSQIAKYQTEQAAQNQAGQLDLQRKMFSEDARAGRGKQAALADLLANLQDVSIDVPGIQTAKVAGGLRPSAMGATGRQGMAELSKQALAALMQGDTFTGGEILKGPQITGPQQAGGLEKGLNWAGLLGSLVGGVGKSLKQEEEEGKYSALPGNSSSATPWNGRL